MMNNNIFQALATEKDEVTLEVSHSTNAWTNRQGIRESDDKLKLSSDISTSRTNHMPNHIPNRREFPSIVNESNTDNGWGTVSYSKKKTSNKYDQHVNGGATRIMNIPVSQVRLDDNKPIRSSYASMAKSTTHQQHQQPQQNIRRSIQSSTIDDKTDIKRKTFTAQSAPRSTGEVVLPEYYKNRMGEDKNQYEIPQYEYEWIKRVGGLEKSESIENMWKGAMTCAISYFENNDYLQRNKFFANKINAGLAENEKMQENLIETICMQTTAILFHRLIKSDSVETVKTLLNSLPLYKAVNMHNYGSKYGTAAYSRIRLKYIDDLRIANNKKQQANKEEIAEAKKRIRDTNDRWNHYILQSVWNGNNPTHDCLYYGAYHSFEALLQHYLSTDMYVQLNNMLLVPNIQNESHYDIVENGKKSCEKQKAYIIRASQFQSCERLYNKTIQYLRDELPRIIEKEATMILSDSMSDQEMEIITQLKTELKTDDTGSESEGDNTNVVEMIKQGNIEGMITFIKRNKDKHAMICRTFQLWTESAKSDEILSDYLEDIKSYEEIMDIYTTAESKNPVSSDS